MKLAAKHGDWRRIAVVAAVVLSFVFNALHLHISGAADSIVPAAITQLDASHLADDKASDASGCKSCLASKFVFSEPLSDIVVEPANRSWVSRRVQLVRASARTSHFRPPIG